MLDVNECLHHNGSCSHGCVNTPAGHYCACPYGLHRDPSSPSQCIDAVQLRKRIGFLIRNEFFFKQDNYGNLFVNSVYLANSEFSSELISVAWLEQQQRQDDSSPPPAVHIARTPHGQLTATISDVRVARSAQFSWNEHQAPLSKSDFRHRLKMTTLRLLI